MKIVKCYLSEELESIEIHIFADLHLGDKHCQLQAIKNRINYIKNTQNAYCLLNGDILDMATKSSIGDTYEESLTPMEQIKTAISLFSPIDDKIIGITSGNHCGRAYKMEGIDLMYFLASELKLRDKYDPIANLVFIRFGRVSSGKKESNGSGKIRKMCYTIYQTHGSSSGRTIGAKANGLQRMGDVVKADVCVISHTHSPLCFKESYYEVDKKNSAVLKKDMVYVNSGSELEYAGSYAEKMSLRPSSLAQPVVHLSGTKFNINVLL